MVEITRVLPARLLHGYPCGIRVIVRRERPCPGVQLDAFEEADGWRDTAFVTDTSFGPLAASTPDTARPGSKTASAARRTPGLEISPAYRSRSTKPG